MPARLPVWAREIIAAYESGAASQFVLYGNLHDRFSRGNGSLGSLRDFFMEELLARFDVVLSYDLGNGVRVEKGRELFGRWPGLADANALPKTTRGGIELLTRYFRYGANLAALGQAAPRAACIVSAADLVAGHGPATHELSALALLLREWSLDPQLTAHPLATFLLTENLNDLHPLLAGHARAARVEIPLPGEAELERALHGLAPGYPQALSAFSHRLGELAAQLRGTTLVSVENQLKRAEYEDRSLQESQLTGMRRQLVEAECGGLIEFIEPHRSLDDFHGQPLLKRALRQDLALWQTGEAAAMPKGYLICGPVGTGKTYLVECLAGEAAVPVVKLGNFRNKWIGSTEGNLEKIFRLLRALGRCFVFIDEADQALGKRDTGSSDSGLSGRVYSMFATEMSREENRGRVIWVLGTSRPDLVEVDLKRPGRIDVKLPVFPCADIVAAFDLLAALCARRGLSFSESERAELEPSMPPLLTAGAAEALALKIYRIVKADRVTPVEATRNCLSDYRPPVAPGILRAQIELAVAEASDLALVPDVFREMAAKSD